MNMILGICLTVYGGWLMFKYSYYVLKSEQMEPVMMEVIEKSYVSSRHGRRRYRYVYRYEWKGKKKTFIHKSDAYHYIGDAVIFLVDPLLGIVYVDESTTATRAFFGIVAFLTGIGSIVDILIEIYK